MIESWIAVPEPGLNSPEPFDGRVAGDRRALQAEAHAGSEKIPPPFPLVVLPLIVEFVIERSLASSTLPSW